MKTFAFGRPELSNKIKLAICKSGNQITRNIYGILNSDLIIFPTHFIYTFTFYVCLHNLSDSIYKFLLLSMK